MQTLHFTKTINAPVEKVWTTMLSDETYKEWTALFDPGSHFVGSWEKGSEMRFIGPEEDGTHSGMISKIEENVPYQQITIKHLGSITKGVEDLSEGENSWHGAIEAYTFKKIDDDITKLEINVDVIDEFKDFMQERWLLALDKLKELSEK